MRTTRGNILSLITALALLAALPLAAQPPGDEEVPGATWEQGTVVNMTDDAIMIERPDGGQLTFFIDEHTVGVIDYQPGTRVRIDYIRAEDGRMMAREIIGPGEAEAADITAETEPPAGESQVTDIETTPSTATTEVEDVEVQAEAETEMHAEAETDLGTEDEWADTDAQAGFGEETDTLPATASELPLVALLGLLALAGAVAVRRARR